MKYEQVIVASLLSFTFSDWKIKGISNTESIISTSFSELFPQHSSSIYVNSTENSIFFMNYPSSARRRCVDYLACEYFNPIIELSNIIIENGNIIITNPDNESLRVLNEISTIYASQNGYLPACLASYSSVHDWVLGPKVIIRYNNSIKSIDHCQTIWNSNLFFHFPWETRNAYHSLNDNLLALLSSILLQFFSFPYHKSPSHHTNNNNNNSSYKDSYPTHKLSRQYTLFLFNKDPIPPSTATLLFKILHQIFPNGQIFHASKILTRGPHCVRHMSWGNAMKPFYKDSLITLRRVLHVVLKKILQLNRNMSSTVSITSSMNTTDSHQLKRPAKENLSKNKPLKVVIVTRNTTLEDTNPYRKLSTDTETSIMKEFLMKGAAAEICCNFQIINTPELLLQHFQDVNICIGMHGAGLSNCVFAANNSLLIEFQHQHGFGFDSFMKIAHMTGGSYLFIDTREALKKRGKGAGAILDAQTIQLIVHKALLIYNNNNNNNNNNNIQPYISTELPHSRKLNGQKKKSVVNNRKKTKVNNLLYINTSDHNNNRNSHGQRNNNNNNNNFELEVGKFGIFPYRYYKIISHNLRKDAIFGPKLERLQSDCQSWPYYQFRLATMPESEHRYECDKMLIRRKPNGALKHNLLKDFTRYSGGDLGGLLPRYHHVT